MLSLSKYYQSHNKLLLTRYTRQWIEKNDKINVLNYFYYRYFTNSFELFLVNLLEN